MHAPAHYSRASIGFGRPWTPMVKMLILVNGGIFLAQIVLGRSLIVSFGLDTTHPFQLWRYVSYLFLHGSPVHLLFNMFALWMFGSDLEDYFGRHQFLRYYFFTGIGAGLTGNVRDRANTAAVEVGQKVGKHDAIVGGAARTVNP